MKSTIASKRMKGLVAQNAQLKGQLSAQNAEVVNTLSQLAFSTGATQTALTSFNPILANNIYAPLTLNYTALTYFYKTHGVIQTAIDMPVLDALRGGLDIKSDDLDEEELGDLQDFLEEYDVLGKLGEGMIWTRLYGGGGLIVNTDQDPSTPLSLKGIKSLDFYPFNRWEMQSPGVNPNQPWELMGFGVPVNQERFLFYGQNIHRSRILIMSGKPAPYMVKWQLQGWGMSEVEKMVEDFNLFIKTRNVLYEILEEAKIDVYKMQGFNDALVSSAGTAQAETRIQLVNRLKNFHRAVLLDAEDDFDQKQLTFSGLAEVMKENRIGIASALRMPLTKLFGLSASGFNSGEDDIENYNAMVESEVRQPMRRPVRKLLKLVALLKFGGEFDLKFGFKPLRVLSAVDEEAVKTSKQNRITQLHSSGLADDQETGEMLEKEELVSIPLGITKGLREAVPPAGAMGLGEDGTKGEGNLPGEKGGGKTEGKPGDDGKTPKEGD